MRVLALSRLDGHPPASRGRARTRSAAKLQRLSIPGGGELFTRPRRLAARRRSTTMFVADENGTAAYVLRGGRLLPGVAERNAGHEPGAGGRPALRL